MFGFIVAACLRETRHFDSLSECLESLDQFHADNKKIVIVDFTSDRGLVSAAVIKFPTVIFEVDTPEVPADMLSLYFFQKKHYFDTAIVLQDSMKILQAFDVQKIDDINYLWYFRDHVHWAGIPEPQTEFNIKNNIRNHDDLILYCLKNLTKKINFQSYALDIYFQKNRWSGCFGCCCVVTHNFLNKLDSDTGIIDIMLQMTSNRLRRAIESIFSLACQYSLNKEIHYGFDGLYNCRMTGPHVTKKSFDRQ